MYHAYTQQLAELFVSLYTNWLMQYLLCGMVTSLLWPIKKSPHKGGIVTKPHCIGGTQHKSGKNFKCSLCYHAYNIKDQSPLLRVVQTLYFDEMVAKWINLSMHNSITVYVIQVLNNGEPSWYWTKSCIVIVQIKKPCMLAEDGCISVVNLGPLFLPLATAWKSQEAHA